MSIKTSTFDVQEHLRSMDEQAAYIDAALETNDASFIAVALGDIAKARGVSVFAQETGISRETIYKTFKAGGNPTLDTLTKVGKALGLRLTMVAASGSEPGTSSL